MNSVPPCETLHTSHVVFRSRGDHKGHGEGAGQALKTLCALCASVRNFLSLPRRFGSHGDHRGHGGGAEKALKNLCSKLCLSRSPQRPRRGRQRFKNLCALCASVRNFLYFPRRFGSHGDHRGHGGGGRKSVEKPLREILPLPEFAKIKERGQAKI